MSGKRIEDKNVLLQRKVWVLLQYSDGSEFCFETTLNSELLQEYGIQLEEGCLPRLDKKYYWGGQYVYRQFPFAGTRVSLWDTCTYTHAPSQRMHEFL